MHKCADLSGVRGQHSPDLSTQASGQTGMPYAPRWWDPQVEEGKRVVASNCSHATTGHWPMTVHPTMSKQLDLLPPCALGCTCGGAVVGSAVQRPAWGSVCRHLGLISLGGDRDAVCAPTVESSSGGVARTGPTYQVRCGGQRHGRVAVQRRVTVCHVTSQRARDDASRTFVWRWRKPGEALGS